MLDVSLPKHCLRMRGCHTLREIARNLAFHSINLVVGLQRGSKTQPPSFGAIDQRCGLPDEEK
jgi:hypothetical protein